MFSLTILGQPRTQPETAGPARVALRTFEQRNPKEWEGCCQHPSRLHYLRRQERYATQAKYGVAMTVPQVIT